MAQIVRLELDREALIDEAFAYVTARRPARVRRQLHELIKPTVGAGLREPIRGRLGVSRPSPILDAMLLDGIRRREDVAALVDLLLTEAGFQL